jgi:Arc/MetJ family transcription regulator
MAVVYMNEKWYIQAMTKRLVDIDDRLLRAAQRRLQTRTIKETVNVALRAAAGANRSRIKQALDDLGRASLNDREAAWR